MIPFIKLSKFDEICRVEGPIRSGTISTLNYNLSILGLKCSGVNRYYHSIDLRGDYGIPIFAGLNKIPHYSSIHRFANDFTTEMINAISIRMARSLIVLHLLVGKKINVDFHNIPCFGEDKSLEKVYIPTRGKAMRGKRVLFGQDQETTSPFFALSGIQNKEASGAILLLVNRCDELFGKGNYRLIFDSKTTNYRGLNKLNKGDVKFITLRRRGKNLIADFERIPNNELEQVDIDNPRRKYKHLKVLDENINLRHYEEPVRQIVFRNHGREKPTFLVSNEFAPIAKELITDFTHRWRIENNLSENVDFFALNALPSYQNLKIDVDLICTLLADNLYKAFAREINDHEKNKPEVIFRKFIHKNANVKLRGEDIIVRFDYFEEQHHIRLMYEYMNEILQYKGFDPKVSWLLNKKIKYEFKR